ncbi:hypothetical protein GPROT1_03323 [Gammaproteobacteria bacterium]|nr:hypothetical protein GPROT1_03323 [Gammaproteobacteria bacterium]
MFGLDPTTDDIARARLPQEHALASDLPPIGGVLRKHATSIVALAERCVSLHHAQVPPRVPRARALAPRASEPPVPVHEPARAE